MDDKNLKALLKHWGVAPHTVTAIYRTAWEVDGRYILKCGKSAADVERGQLFSQLLYKEGLPVATYHKTRDASAFVLEDGRYYVLMSKLKGAHLDVYQAGEELPFTLGTVLAKLHVALKKIEGQTGGQQKQLFEEWTHYILPEIEQRVPVDMLQMVQKWLENVYPTLPRHLIHRDPHMGNLLFENGVLTGYIDFDLSVDNVRIFDLCYFALSLLISNTEDAEKSGRWPLIFSEIVDGYEVSLPLTETERKSFKPMMLYIELLFVAYWSKSGNAEQTEEALKMATWVMAHLL